MFKRGILLCVLLNSCLSIAAPLSGKDLQGTGRALANYQICYQLAEVMKDKAMHSYYLEMFNDTSREVDSYPKAQSEIVLKEFNLGVGRLAKLNQNSMELFCLSRFDALSRKMQEKKLAGITAVSR